jgi:hypothetical protein
MAKSSFPASFPAYRRMVDALVEAKCGLSLDDLPDVCLMDWFEDRVRPAAAAARAIRAAKEF